ncbi:hypothetical protein AB1N83_012319 [Pleurotus pulmonarius]
MKTMDQHWVPPPMSYVIPAGHGWITHATGALWIPQCVCFKARLRENTQLYHPLRPSSVQLPDLPYHHCGRNDADVACVVSVFVVLEFTEPNERAGGACLVERGHENGPVFQL